MANDLMKLSGLWKNEDKNGNVYFSGGFTYGNKLLIMKNTYKEKDNEPDYIAYLAPKKDKDAGQEKQAQDNSDIPF